MKMTPDNWLYAIKQIVVGSSKKNVDGSSAADGGFNADFPFDLNDVTLGTGTTASSTGNVPILSNAATNTSVGLISWLVPRDYDANTDKLIVRVLAKSGGTTNTPTLTFASSTTALGGTVGVAGTSVTSAAISSTLAAYEFDLSNQGLVRDTILSGLLSTSAHATDAVQVFAIQIVYASCLVAFDDSTNTAGKSVGYDALGNPLR